MSEPSAFPPSLHPGPDQALLAFIKCHVTSLAKWHALRMLCDEPGHWLDAPALRRQYGPTVQEIAQALVELAREGVVERRAALGGQQVYRLTAEDPTTSVVTRLVAAVGHSPELREILVANLLRSAAAA